MLKNYLKIALRRIQKQKLLSFINIGGLALGIACFLLISVYINHEMSYDNFHKNIKNIYRIYTIDNEPSGRKYSAMSPHPLPKALENDFPKLTNVVCINNPLEDEIKTDKNIYKEKIMFASPNFFNMFDFPYRAGTYKQLSKNINTIIITEDLSKKIFGNDISLGKTLTVHGKYDFIVGGVIKNIPSNSSFQFDAFISDEFLYRYIYPNEDKKWNSMGVETYVEFSPAISPQYLKSQFPIILNKYLPDYMKGRFGLDIQPLRDIHTNMDIESRITTQVSKLTLLIFFIIACTILAIASINFINLSTVLFIERQKEIGIRKV